MLSKPVASAVEDSDPDVRRLALRDLGYRGELAKDHLSLIESSLEHSHQGTSIAAALALHSLDPKAYQPFPHSFSGASSRPNGSIPSSWEKWVQKQNGPYPLSLNC